MATMKDGYEKGDRLWTSVSMSCPDGGSFFFYADQNTDVLFACLLSITLEQHAASSPLRLDVLVLDIFFSN